MRPFPAILRASKARAALVLATALAVACGGEQLTMYSLGGARFGVLPPVPPARDPVDAGAEDESPAAPPRAAMAAALVKRIAENLPKTQGTGAAVAVVVEGRILVADGVGTVSHDTSEPVTADTLFRWASVTKVVTALAAVRLAEDGQLDLSAPLTKYVPDLATADPAWTPEITLHRALTHTAGLRDDDGAPCPEGPRAFDAYVSARRGQKLLARPGAAYVYSNTGFVLVGAAVEHAAAHPFEEVVRRRVLRPAGMVSATFDGSLARGHAHADGVTSDGARVPIDAYACRPMRAAGGLIASAQHMGRLLEVLLGMDDHVLARGGRDKLLAPHVSTQGPLNEHAAYGMGAVTYRGLSVRAQTGRMPGFASVLLLVPERRFGIAIALNTEVVPMGTALWAVDHFLAPTEPPPTFPPTPSAPLATFEGRYVDRAGALGRLRIEARPDANGGAGGLVVRFDGGQSWPLDGQLVGTFFPGPLGPATYFATRQGVAERQP